jgi:hypothetical protein
MAPIVEPSGYKNQQSMYLGFWRLNARKPASLLGVSEKCAAKVSKSGHTGAGRYPEGDVMRCGVLDSGLRRNECACEGAITAWWKSVSGQAKTPKLKVTASLRSGVASNRKRTGGPQDNELDSAGCGDEPAHSWRSLELA